MILNHGLTMDNDDPSSLHIADIYDNDELSLALVADNADISPNLYSL